MLTFQTFVLLLSVFTSVLPRGDQGDPNVVEHCGQKSLDYEKVCWKEAQLTKRISCCYSSKNYTTFEIYLVSSKKISPNDVAPSCPASILISHYNKTFSVDTSSNQSNISNLALNFSDTYVESVETFAPFREKHPIHPKYKCPKSLDSITHITNICVCILILNFLLFLINFMLFMRSFYPHSVDNTTKFHTDHILQCTSYKPVI